MRGVPDAGEEAEADLLEAACQSIECNAIIIIIILNYEDDNNNMGPPYCAGTHLKEASPIDWPSPPSPSQSSG